MVMLSNPYKDNPTIGGLLVNSMRMHRSARGSETTYAVTSFHKRAFFNRSALVITLTEESAMAAAEIMGDNKMPKVG